MAKNNDEKEIIELRHKYKMQELEFERESSNLFHQQELERIRIKSAEIRRQQERKSNMDFISRH